MQAGIELSNVEDNQTESASERIEVAIDVEGLEAPAAEKELHAALEGLSGVEILSLEGGKATLRYDPVETALAEIHQAIERGGFKMGEEESTRSSPSGDIEKHDHTGAS